MNQENDSTTITQVFVNKIVKGERCATFGNQDILQNSDTAHSYTVTIEEFSSGSHSGGTNTTQKTVFITAGGKVNLGCDQVPGFGSPSVRRSVVGEERH